MTTLHSMPPAPLETGNGDRPLYPEVPGYRLVDASSLSVGDTFYVKAEQSPKERSILMHGYEVQSVDPESGFVIGCGNMGTVELKNDEKAYIWG